METVPYSWRRKLVKCVLMETVELPHGIRELPIVAGDLALDFANTVDDPGGPQRFDHVATYPALMHWCRRVGMLDEASAVRLLEVAARSPRRATAVVNKAMSLREAINLTAGAVVDGRAVDRLLEDWGLLRPFVSAAVERVELAGLRPSWRFDELGSPLWPVAHAAYVLLTGPTAGRIKQCAGCPWLFVDQSKNGSRRWCSMEICGTNQKVRLYVARRARRRTQS
jgi:predicted RNA-binding Zn ribbon-like protein